jgi:hypothetical protein
MGAEAGAVVATVFTALSNNPNYANNLVCGAGVGYGIGAIADIGKQFLIRWGNNYEVGSAELNFSWLTPKAEIAILIKGLE